MWLSWRQIAHGRSARIGAAAFLRAVHRGAAELLDMRAARSAKRVLGRPDPGRRDRAQPVRRDAVTGFRAAVADAVGGRPPAGGG